MKKTTLKSRKLKIAKNFIILPWLLKRPKGQNPVPQKSPNAGLQVFTLFRLGVNHFKVGEAIYILKFFKKKVDCFGTIPLC